MDRRDEKKSEKFIRYLTRFAGITIDGENPWDIKVHDERFYDRVFHQGLLGLGESYMDGWWDCEKLDEFFYHVLRANLDQKLKAEGHHILSMTLAKFNLIKAYDYQCSKSSPFISCW